MQERPWMRAGSNSPETGKTSLKRRCVYCGGGRRTGSWLVPGEARGPWGGKWVLQDPEEKGKGIEARRCSPPGTRDQGAEGAFGHRSKMVVWLWLSEQGIEQDWVTVLRTEVANAPGRPEREALVSGSVDKERWWGRRSRLALSGFLFCPVSSPFSVSHPGSAPPQLRPPLSSLYLQSPGAHMCHFDLITRLLRLPSLPQPLATVARFVPSASNTSLLSLGLTSSSPCSRPVSSDLLMVPSTGIHSPGEILWKEQTSTCISHRMCSLIHEIFPLSHWVASWCLWTSIISI